MNKYISAFLLGIVLPVTLLAQPKLIEKVGRKSANEIVIPYEKYVLPNGLTVIVHEDHSDPICHVDVTYHVGSAREEIGKSGFAHFFEHMMFQGSDNVADEQHFKIITEAGGTLNGTTNLDRTNYFETVPSNQLEKMLWLEADRMGFLLDAVTQQKFEVQRATVKNERGQNYDNRPYGLVRETLSKNLFPYGHPYSWLTIGYVEDLNRVDVNDLKNFFLRWYGPNNATITVGGDVDTKTVLKLVEKYFGTIPQCPKVTPTVLPMPVIEKDRYVSMVDNYAKLPQLVCAIPTVQRYHKDEAALDCLAQIIGGDNNSILYQQLVKTQKALSASCFNSTSELAGNFQFTITPKAGTPLADMEKELRAAIANFETRGVKDEDIEKFKSSFEANLIYGLESVSGKVSQLASYQTFTGNPNYLQNELKSYTSITKEDVLRVYQQYIKNKAMVILSVLTKGNENVIAAPDNYSVDQNNYKAPDYGYKGLTYTKAKDNFDRSKMPEASGNISVKVPEFKKVEQNNMRMISAQTNEIPTVVLSLEIKGGRLAEQNDLSKAGLANLFCSMMDEDTKKHSAEELSVLLDKLGSSISINPDFDNTSVTVRCLKKNLNATLDILMERLNEPLFKQETFDRIKTQTIENIKNSKTRAANVVGIAYNKINYGATSVMGMPGVGEEKTVQTISLQDIEQYYKNYFSRYNMDVVVVGDVTDKETAGIMTRLMSMPNYPVKMPQPLQNIHQTNPKTIFMVNVPKAAQTEFRIGYVTELKYDATGEYYKVGLMNYPLGGAFNSRVNLNLREDKGWTYGARSGFSGNEYTGSFTFSSGIKSAVTDSALVEVLKEIDNFYNNGIKEEELSFLKKAIGQSDARKYETGFQKAGFIGNILRYKLDKNYVDKQNKILNEINANEINALAKTYLNTSMMNIVLAGDKDKIAPALQQLGYTIVELSPDGDKL